MIETKEKTALNPTVGAVEGQSILCTGLSIAETTQNFNENFSTECMVDIFVLILVVFVKFFVLSLSMV